MKATVLVAEDEFSFAEALEILLGMHGFKVIVASDGAQALRRFGEARPDIVVADMMMPFVDGLELARAVRAMPDLEDLPMILMSAGAEPPPHATGLFNAFLRKPIDVGKLLHLLETLPTARGGRR